MVWVWYPDTRNKPLEELAVLFGDAEEVAVYSEEIVFDPNSRTLVDRHGEKSGAVEKEVV